MAFEPARGYDPARAAETQIRWPMVKILRPRQWIKNALVLAPLIFSGLFTDPVAIGHALAAAGLFCLASSATYVWNDLNDIEADRDHPVKRHTRPLAAGELRPATAQLELVGLLVVLAAGILVEPKAMAAIGGYLAVNAAYNAGLKAEPVLDLFAVSAGFVLRVFAGALAISVAVSPWMLITTLCLALYLATQKRLQEQEDTGEQARSVLGEYPTELLERYSHLTALGAIVFYGLYTAKVRPDLALTMPLVLLGFFRFSFVQETQEGGEDPIAMALGDRVVAATVVCWGIASILLVGPI